MKESIRNITNRDEKGEINGSIKEDNGIMI